MDEKRHMCDLDYSISLVERDGGEVHIHECDEGEDGRLWAGNLVRWSQVNFCPICGYEAKVKVK